MHDVFWQMIVDPKSEEIKDLGFNPADYPELDEIYQLCLDLHHIYIAVPRPEPYIYCGA